MRCLAIGCLLACGIGCEAGVGLVSKMPTSYGSVDGKNIDSFELKNAGGVSVTVITFGGTITSIRVPDRAGNLGEITLGHDSLEKYRTQSPYFGAAIGRFGNRIAKGQFTLDGKTHQLPINNGPNSLHGGKVGYDKRVWTAEPVTSDGASLKLSLIDTDGTEGYPGTVHVSIVYTLTNDNILRLQYEATTDQPTPINLTNHTYFNLKDAGESSILEHVIRLDADRYTVVDNDLIPTGELRPVAGTPFDFTKPEPIGQDLKSAGGNPVGYDHNFVLRSTGHELKQAAEVYEPTTGRLLQVFTTEPGIQFYSGNFLDGSITGRGGTVYNQYDGFCLETQHFPDAPNQKSFPNTVLRPGETYRSVTEYRFDTK